MVVKIKTKKVEVIGPVYGKRSIRRKFDGKVFKLKTYYSNKADAEKLAGKMRREATEVRITTELGINNKNSKMIDIYTIWYRYH
jgi:hypothetical protein